MAEWLEHRAHDREVVGSILTLVAVCTLGKRALLLFPHSTQVYLKWVPGTWTANELYECLRMSRVALLVAPRGG